MTGQRESDEEMDDSAPERALVARWLERIQFAKRKWEPEFKRMRDDMMYARFGADEKWVKNKNYYVPIVPRMISIAVAAMYAKDPVFVSEPARRLTLPAPLDDPAAVQAAMMTPEDPKSQQVLNALSMARQEKVMMRRFAETVECLVAHFVRKMRPKFKGQMKSLVRRAKTTGVGFVKLDFQRSYTPRPEITQQIADANRTVERLVFLKEQADEGDLSDIDARLEEAKIITERLQIEPGEIAEEGPVLDFLKSTAVIPDAQCTSLNGFVGADFIAVEYTWPIHKIKAHFRVDLMAGDTGEGQNSASVGRSYKTGATRTEDDEVTFYEVQDRVSQTFFFVAEGYKLYLKKPALPSVQLDRFWTVFALALNESEHESEIYPISDVNALKSTQEEYNSARQALSDHRVAGAPRYLAAKGMMDENDKRRLKQAVPHSVTEIQPPANGGKLSDSIQVLEVAQIDARLYDTEHLFSDMLRLTGAQQANMGALSGASATEASIADNSRSIDVSSQVDDLDDFLTELGECMGEVLMTNLSTDTVFNIVGQGAVWDEMKAQQLKDEIFLSTRAGSTGRPNRGAELQNMERAMLWLQQMPGISEVPLIRKGANLLELDFEELYLEGMPSIMAQNNARPGSGGPDDPAAQGAEGGNQAPRPSQEQTTHQTHPGPMAGAS